MDCLPLFHRVAGQPVVVLGHGDAAAAKRRLVERAGGLVVDDLAVGIDTGARLAFIAHDDEDAVMADALRARGAGLLVNVVDRPALCDFTVPSIVDRNPVLVAVGTGGASAGLAKAVRLRLETLLPQGLGALAEALASARTALRTRWPSARERRQALDSALVAGGPLDPMTDGAADRFDAWLARASTDQETSHYRFVIASPDPDDLTLRAARLLGQADAVIHDPSVPAEILARARADALRLISGQSVPEGCAVIVELAFAPSLDGRERR